MITLLDFVNESLNKDKGINGIEDTNINESILLLEGEIAYLINVINDLIYKYKTTKDKNKLQKIKAQLDKLIEEL